MTHITDPSKHTISVRLASTIFDDIAAEISQLLDVQPSGVTQESVWLHLKKIGQKASVDQVRITLDKLTQRGELVDAKNGKNETVWKRARKPGVIVTVSNVSMLKDALEKVGAQARQQVEQSVTKALANLRTADASDNDLAAAATHVTFVQATSSADAIDLHHGDRRFAVVPTHIEPPTSAEELPAMTPPIDPPPAQPNQKPIVHGARASTPGALIEQQILEALGQGPHTRKQLMDISGASGTGVDNALKRLNGIVARQSTGAWALSESTASGGAAQISLAAPPGAKRSPAKAEAGQGDLESCLARFTQRLQPVSELGEKVAVLDQLSTVLPQPIAERLVQIRQDLVRVGS